MSWVGASLGVLLGFGLRMFANGMQKSRALKRPWEHLLMGSIFGVLGYHFDEWRWELRKLLNDHRVNRGLPPIRFRGEMEGSDIMEAAEVVRQADVAKESANIATSKSE